MTGFNQNSRETPLFLFQNEFIGPVGQFLRLVSGLELVGISYHLSLFTRRHMYSWRNCFCASESLGGFCREKRAPKGSLSVFSPFSIKAPLTLLIRTNDPAGYAG